MIGVFRRYPVSCLFSSTFVMTDVFLSSDVRRQDDAHSWRMYLCSKYGPHRSRAITRSIVNVDVMGWLREGELEEWERKIRFEVIGLLFKLAFCKSSVEVGYWVFNTHECMYRTDKPACLSCIRFLYVKSWSVGRSADVLSSLGLTRNLCHHRMFNFLLQSLFHYLISIFNVVEPRSTADSIYSNDTRYNHHYPRPMRQAELGSAKPKFGGSVISRMSLSAARSQVASASYGARDIGGGGRGVVALFFSKSALAGG